MTENSPHDSAINDSTHDSASQNGAPHDDSIHDGVTDNRHNGDTNGSANACDAATKDASTPGDNREGSTNTGAAPPDQATNPAFRRFHRSRRDRMIAGVCRGVENTYGIDAALCRVVLVVATILGFGVGILVYLACWLFAPLDPDPATPVLAR